MVRRVAEHEVAIPGFGEESQADVVASDLGAAGVEVGGEAPPAHGLGDVEHGPAAGHRVDHQRAGGGEVEQGVGDDGGGDRARVGDPEGAVVAEGPDVVRGGAEVAAELVAAAEVLVGRVDRLGSGVEL